MEKTVRKAAGIGLLLLPLCTPLAARDVLTLSLEDLAHLPVTAGSGYAQPRAEVPGTVHVIQAGQWEALGAQSVWDVLEHLPGLYVTESFGERQVVARGMISAVNSEVLWLLDGQPLNSFATGALPPVFDKGLAGLERIEFIRGPVSVVHGSSAFSAVINLVSRAAGAGENRVSAGAGSFGTRQAQAEAGGGQGDWRWRASLEQRRNDGDGSRVIDADLQTTLDALLGTQVSLAPGRLPAGDDVGEAQLRLEWRQSSLQYWHWQNDADTRLGPGNAGNSLNPGHNDIRLDHLALRQTGEMAAHAMRWELEALWQRQDVRINSIALPPGAVAPIGTDGNFDFMTGNPVSFPAGLIGDTRTQSDRYRLGFNLINTRFEGHTLRLGLGHEHDVLQERESRRNFGPGVLDGSQPAAPVPPLPDFAGTSLSFLPDRERDIAFVALQDDWRINADWLLNLGVRHDHYSDFGTSTSPRASLQWQATPHTRLRAGYGSAFRAPSFAELYLRNNPSLVGNPDLHAEELQSGEIGVEHSLGEDLRLDAVFFHFDARGLIDYVNRPPGTELVAANIEGREGRGTTLEMHWQPQQGLRLNANLALWEVEDMRNNTHAPFVPKQMAGVNGWWEFAPKWTLGGAVRHVADRKREAGDPRDDINDNTWADLHLYTTALAPGLRLGLTVQNVGDADLRDPTRNLPGLGPAVPRDMPLPGRSWLFEAEYRWGSTPAAPASTTPAPAPALPGDPAPAASP